MDDAEITDKLGLYSLHQRHWYIANTCALAVYFYGLAMEEDPPDSNALHYRGKKLEQHYRQKNMMDKVILLTAQQHCSGRDLMKLSAQLTY